MTGARRLAAATLAALLMAPATGVQAADAPLAPLAPSAASAPAVAAVPADTAARPATLQTEITLEGTAEPITLQRFDWAAAPRPQAFSTYVPQDMVVRPSGRAVRFVANFGGVLQPQAYLEVVFLPTGISQAQAAAAAARSLPGVAQRPGRAPAQRQFDWSLAEYDFSYRTKGGSQVTAFTALGRHAGRYFRLTMHHPLEYGDGFPPRADLIVQHWRWRDTRAGL